MNKVKRLMLERNMNTSDLMRASGLSWPTCDEASKVQDWPTEKTQWGTIEAIASALGVSSEYLVSENNDGH